jgi:hypothetical protein
VTTGCDDRLAGLARVPLGRPAMKPRRNPGQNWTYGGVGREPGADG